MDQEGGVPDICLVKKFLNSLKKGSIESEMFFTTHFIIMYVNIDYQLKIPIMK